MSRPQKMHHPKPTTMRDVQFDKAVKGMIDWLTDNEPPESLFDPLDPVDALRAKWLAFLYWEGYYAEIIGRFVSPQHIGGQREISRKESAYWVREHYPHLFLKDFSLKKKREN
jgi:hypothetical protein